MSTLKDRITLKSQIRDNLMEVRKLLKVENYDDNIDFYTVDNLLNESKQLALVMINSSDDHSVDLGELSLQHIDEIRILVEQIRQGRSQ